MKIFKKKIRESSILYQRSKGEKVLFGIVFVLFFLYAASLIFPLLWLLINSLQDRTIYEVNLALGNAFEFPSALHWENYSYAFTQLSYNGANIFMMFFNSIWYTLAYTLGGVLMSAFTGYALAKYRFKLRGFMYGVIIFTMTIPTVGTTGALFNLVYNVLHIYDSPLYVILKHLCGTGLNFWCCTDFSEMFRGAMPRRRSWTARATRACFSASCFPGAARHRDAQHRLGHRGMERLHGRSHVSAEFFPPLRRACTGSRGRCRVRAIPPCILRRSSYPCCPSHSVYLFFQRDHEKFCRRRIKRLTHL